MASPSAELVVLIPVLRRPQRVKPVLEAFRDTVPDGRILFIADSDDREELAALDAEGAEVLSLDPPVNWAQKINAGYRATSEPVFFIAADDVHPHSGWYERAKAKMEPGIGVVGTNDLANPSTMQGGHATHMLVRRSYIEEFSGVMDEPDTVIHEGYPHEFADAEFVQTAQFRGAYAHALDSVVEHLHPIVGNTWHPNGRESLPDDETYRLGRSQTSLSRQIFGQRMRMWTQRS